MRSCWLTVCSNGLQLFQGLEPFPKRQNKNLADDNSNFDENDRQFYLNTVGKGEIVQAILLFPH